MIININKPEELKKKMMSRGMSDEEATTAVEKFINSVKSIFNEEFDDNDDDNDREENDTNE